MIGSIEMADLPPCLPDDSIMPIWRDEAAPALNSSLVILETGRNAPQEIIIAITKSNIIKFPCLGHLQSDIHLNPDKTVIHLNAILSIQFITAVIILNHNIPTNHDLIRNSNLVLTQEVV